MRGGVHLPDYHKRRTEAKEIRVTEIPQKVILPLQQNLGCPAEPLVKVGDAVIEGQKIADSSKLISAPVHAAISGKVTQVTGEEIVIEGNGEEHRAPNTEHRAQENISPQEIRQIVREAGIVGLGGAAFPTHVKLAPPPGKKIDTLIINGCECEPYITADHRLMLERAEDVLFGAQMMAKAVGAERIIVGVEENKRDAAKALTPIPSPYGRGEKEVRVEVTVLQTKYPQGGEKQLIQALLKREVPSGGLPHDVRVLVQNVGTAAAVTEAIRFGKPLIQRVVTVTGSGVREPQNLLARIGTPFSKLINQCGGLTEDAEKIIVGGPMMGTAMISLDDPLKKCTTCILVLNKRDVKLYEEGPCIRCGRCIKSCPIGLLPNFIADAAKLKNWDRTAEYHVADCIECGCCAYVCPARIFLVQYFKIAKKELQLRKVVCQ